MFGHKKKIYNYTCGRVSLMVASKNSRCSENDQGTWFADGAD